MGGSEYAARNARIHGGIDIERGSTVERDLDGSTERRKFGGRKGCMYPSR